MRRDFHRFRRIFVDGSNVASGFLRGRPNVALHFSGPLQKTPQVVAFPPEEIPKLKEVDLLHFDAAIGLNPPQKIGTAPGRDAVAAGGVPDEAEHGEHLSL